MNIKHFGFSGLLLLEKWLDDAFKIIRALLAQYPSHKVPLIWENVINGSEMN